MKHETDLHLLAFCAIEIAFHSYIMDEMPELKHKEFRQGHFDNRGF